MRGKPPINRVHEVLAYDGVGGLRWKIQRPHCRDTGKVGYTRPDGYVRVRIDRHHVFAHHIVWALCNGAWPAKDIDHANGDRSDNRIENLRLAEPFENQANQKRSARNTTGYKGVSRVPSGRYSAMLQKRGQTFYLGTFDDPVTAHKAYSQAAEKYHGEFARID